MAYSKSLILVIVHGEFVFAFTLTASMDSCFRRNDLLFSVTPPSSLGTLIISPHPHHLLALSSSLRTPIISWHSHHLSAPPSSLVIPAFPLVIPAKAGIHRKVTTPSEPVHSL